MLNYPLGTSVTASEGADMSLSRYSSDEGSDVIITTVSSCCKWTACAWLPTTDLIHGHNSLLFVFSQPGSSKEDLLFPSRMINGF